VEGQQQDEFAVVLPVLVAVITPVFLLILNPDDCPRTLVISKVADFFSHEGVQTNVYYAERRFRKYTSGTWSAYYRHEDK